MADARDEAEHFEVLGEDGVFYVIDRGVEDFAGYFGADTADGDELAEEIEFVVIGEAVEIEGIFADVAVDEERGLVV